MKCKVFLVGEGTSDIGDLALELPYRRGRDGFLQPLLRKMVGETVELEFDGQKLAYLRKEPAGEITPGELQSENAGRALGLAAQHRANVLVLACDADKTPGKRAKRLELKRRLHLLRKSARDGFEHERERDKDVAPIQTVIAVPGRMIEAWALGDRKALAGLLQRVRRPVRNARYGEPETLWGDEDDPESDHPKRVWERVTRGRIGFAEIGAEATPSVLAKACPESFPPFAEDVERALDECPVANGDRPPSSKARVTRRRSSAAKLGRRARPSGRRPARR